jgi:proline dehydrogenase
MVDFSGLLRRMPNRDSLVSVIDQVPATRGAISPFVPGETVAAAVAAVGTVQASGMSASVAYLPDPQALASCLLVHMQTIEALDAANLSEGADLMVDLAALGLSRGADPASVSTDLAILCAAAEEVGMTVTVDGVAHEHLDDTLSIHAALAGEHPDLGVTIAANLLRSEADCGDLARAGARVRLVRQASAEPPGLSFARGHEVDKAYVRCARLLMAAGARTVIATHDPRLIEIATVLAVRSDRDPANHSFQFRLGVRPDAAAELVSSGSQVSILVPFGPDWATYMARRIALKPNSISQAARAALGR